MPGRPSGRTGERKSCLRKIPVRPASRAMKRAAALNARASAGSGPDGPWPAIVRFSSTRNLPSRGVTFSGTGIRPVMPRGVSGRPWPGFAAGAAAARAATAKSAAASPPVERIIFLAVFMGFCLLVMIGMSDERPVERVGLDVDPLGLHLLAVHGKGHRVEPGVEPHQPLPVAVIDVLHGLAVDLPVQP